MQSLKDVMFQRELSPPETMLMLVDNKNIHTESHITINNNVVDKLPQHKTRNNLFSNHHSTATKKAISKPTRTSSAICGAIRRSDEIQNPMQNTLARN